MLKLLLVCIGALCVSVIAAVDSGERNFTNRSNGSDLDSEILKESTENVSKSEEENEKESYTFTTESINHDPVDINEAKDPFKSSRELTDDKGDGALADQNRVVCTSPPVLDGIISPVLEDNEHPVGTSVTYQCDYGYVSRNSRSLLAVCEINPSTGKAEWTLPDIECIPRSCGDPGYVINGRRIGNLFTFPNKVEFECQEGYKLRGLKARYCQAAGEWSGRLPVCEPIYCTVPPNPVNGRVLYSSLEYGTELEYKCNKGFMLLNPIRRICSDDGKWSNDEPECIETRCKMPEKPERGTVQFYGEPKVGSIAVYSCNDGTAIFGPSTSKCLDTGDWTFGPPKCFYPCVVPVIQNGQLGQTEVVRVNGYRRQNFKPFQVGTSVKHNENVTLVCKDGFLAGNRSSSNTDEVTCSDGLWSKSLHCRESSCHGDPPSMENGYPVIGSRRHGYSIYYECNEGYDKVQFGKVTCTYGEWKGPTPVCADYRCWTNQLNYPGLMKPNKEFYTDKEGFDIQCEKAYKISDWRKRIVCKQGQWQIQNNPCTIKTCDNSPPSLRNGYIRQLTRENGSVVDYVCNQDYLMVDHSPVRCEFGQWEGQPPVCKLSHCPGEPPSIKNGYPVVDKRLHGNSIRYECDEYYGKSQSGNVKCNYGEWEGSTPVCADFRCSTDQLNYPGLIKPEKEFLKHREYFKIKCETDYRKSTRKKNISCNKARWDIQNNPCTAEAKQSVVPASNVSARTNKTAEPVRPNPLSNESGKCLCAYDYSKDEILAYVRGTVIIDAKIETGETIHFTCRSNDKDLVWPDGVRESETALTCKECEVWQLRDLPRCENRQQENCEDEPPVPLNGKAREFSRTPGSIINYECNEGFEMTDYSGVECESGQWKGQPPDCKKLASDPNVPVSEVSESTVENFEPVHSTPLPDDSKECFCTYDYRKDLITASVGGREIDEAIIRRGERITFACRHNNLDLVWPSGLRFREPISMNCSTCEVWHAHQLPFCGGRQDGDSSILYNENMKFLPTGILEIPMSGSITLRCKNPWGQPAWNVGGREKILLFQDTYTRVLKTGFYVAHLVINFLDNQHAGTYECSFTDLYGRRYRSTLVNLKISAPEVRCPELETHTDRGIFTIVYEEYRRVGTKAYLECKDSSKKMSGRGDRVCLENGRWSGSNPRCEDFSGVETTFDCPLLEENDIFTITYGNRRKVNSIAYYNCKNKAQRIIGSSNRTCLQTGKWSGVNPTCEDITCEEFLIYNALSVSYSNFTKVNSIATFQCSHPATLVGSPSSTCQYDGRWSNPRPSCELLEILCPKLDGKDIFTIQYSNNMAFNSTALFYCKAPNQKVQGCNFMICQQNGEWSGEYPTCVDSVTCDRLNVSGALKVSYSKGVSVGSIASFSCLPPTTLVGSYIASCGQDGAWSQLLPSCKAPDCSIADLVDSGNLPKSVVPDVSGVTSEFVTPGSELKLHCDENLYLTGSSKAACNFLGTWEFGDDMECVSGCTLSKDISPNLIIEPLKDFYRFGESIFLSCPLGYKRSHLVERVMCFGSSWSIEDLPDCLVVEETSPSSLKSTIRS